VLHVLGIDAGGTKTVCQFADGRGEVLAEARRGGANLQASGELEVEKVLHEVMEEAIADHDVRPDAICLGIAGVDRPDDARVVREIMKRSGYWIGRAALRAVLREADRRGPATRLTGLLLNYYGVPKAQDLIAQVYHGTLRPAAIAALAQCVMGAFSDGDAVAIGILRSAADQLESAALSVARRLDLVGSEFPFVLSGGIYRAVPWLEEELKRRLPLAAPKSRTMLLEEEPATGAVRLALAEAHGGYHVPAYKTD
jgi:N-acetylglucosamine kinase-like BadF-type ATPase